MFERISINPNVYHGQACIKGTRIPVHQIIQMLANGDTIEELLEEYPSLEHTDILACLEYAGKLAEEQLSPLETMDG
ncbi:MAG: antitoxin [Bacteroidetes bacterium 4484_249]|nr:MAG: antitoxin [Bacteroidetes bacterium 4484_249]